jgi:thymidylate synthase ThyX
MVASARVVLDSISENGSRLTTFEGTMWRAVLAEFNTHRQFSRNSASSRAIPVKKQLERVLMDPAMPVEWGMNKPGMQADGPADPETENKAKRAWMRARDAAYTQAEELNRLGIHKQVANRLLEPFMWHTVVFTTTTEGLENFFDQRCTSRSPLAQPEMRAFADAVLAAYEASIPLRLENDDWHTPYIQDDEDFPVCFDRMKVSAARCARVSYLTQDGVRDHEEDLRLYERLVSAKPQHWSPLEHVATPCEHETRAHHLGNFRGWDQMRHLVA